jgi:hypothetical protein
VPAACTQAQLRQWFGRWGMPGQLRVDNGTPWGSSDDVPTPLALWLVGLGVGVHWNEPRRPQQNGVAERSMGTFKRWSDPRACRDAAEWQGRLDHEERLYREAYPLPCGQSRLQRWPALAHSGRRYSAAWERRAWSLRAALEHLAGYTLERTVSSQGRLSLFDRSYYVGAVLAGRVVKVYLDPERVEWVVLDRHSAAQLRTFAAVTLTRQNIVDRLEL